MAISLYNVMGVVRGQGRDEEALRLLEEGYRGLARARGPEHKDTITAARRLVECYAAWDKAEPGKGYDAKSEEWKGKMPNAPK